MKTKTYIYYSLLAIALAILGIPLFIYLPTFYATQIGIDMATVGLILFIARISDVISDPIIGYFSDLSKKYFKSRKPIMIVGYIFLIFSFYYILNPNLQYKELWLLVFSILLYFSWSMIQIPYLTYSSELSNYYYEKTKLNSSREFTTILGMILALVLPYIFLNQNEKNTNKDILDLLFYSFIFISIPIFSLFLKNIKSIIKTKSEAINLSAFINIYKTIPTLKYLHFAYFFNNLANAIPATIFLLFITHVIKEEQYSGLLLIIYFFSGILALPFWTYLSNKIKKKNTWIVSIVFACFSFVFVIFLKEGDFILFLIICIISGFSLGVDMAMPTAIQSDIVQKAKENNISSLLFSIWTMITKLSLAFAVAITFIILGLIGFDDTNPSDSSILVLSLLYGLLPILLKFFSIYFIYKFKEDFTN